MTGFECAASAPPMRKGRRLAHQSGRNRRNPSDRAAALDRSAAHPPARGRRCVRTAGGDRAAGAAHPLGQGRRSRGWRTAYPPCCPTPTPGREFLFGATADQSAGRALSRSAPAGDHLLRRAGLDPLLSRDHAADRALGRRRDRLGDRASAGSKRWARRPTSSSASPKARWWCGPISRRWLPPRLFTLMTVGMAGVAGTILAAYAGLLGRRVPAVPAGRRLHVGAGRDPDGQDHHAR